MLIRDLNWYDFLAKNKILLVPFRLLVKFLNVREVQYEYVTTEAESLAVTVVNLCLVVGDGVSEPFSPEKGALIWRYL